MWLILVASKRFFKQDRRKVLLIRHDITMYECDVRHKRLAIIKHRQLLIYDLSEPVLIIWLLILRLLVFVLACESTFIRSKVEFGRFASIAGLDFENMALGNHAPSELR